MQRFSYNDNIYVSREIYQEMLYSKTFCTHIYIVRNLLDIIHDMRKSHHKMDNFVINSFHFLWYFNLLKIWRNFIIYLFIIPTILTELLKNWKLTNIFILRILFIFMLWMMQHWLRFFFFYKFHLNSRNNWVYKK